MSEPVDILLLGFGAVGVVYSYLLEKSGKARVTAVARGNFDLISKNGIRIDSDKFTPKIIEGYKPHRLVRSVEEAADTAYTFVIITTKSLPDILPTEAMLEPIIKAGKSKTFVLIQNGLGIEEGIYAATRAIDATILTSVCYISTNLVGNRDEVRFENTERLEIGVYHPPSEGRTLDTPLPKPTDVQTAALNQFAEIVKAGEGGIKLEEDMELVRFKKVVWNCCWASLACLVRAPLIDFLPALEFVGPSVLEFCNEVEAIGRAASLPLPPNFGKVIYQGTIDFRTKVGGKHKPSALVDLETGRPIEIEVTIGSILRMGRRVGRTDEQMTILRLVYGLMRVIQKVQVDGYAD
ncbi:ketopantoate reductase PanE/ApbA-domain-containing protein [Mrakia frigida]|uniref:ketopantoate reductase family protein n=1 Tax=Mrakia frigida TaxID=29902 RepID=UPI003FCBFBB3